MIFLVLALVLSNIVHSSSSSSKSKSDSDVSSHDESMLVHPSSIFDFHAHDESMLKLFALCPQVCAASEEDRTSCSRPIGTPKPVVSVIPTVVSAEHREPTALKRNSSFIEYESMCPASSSSKSSKKKKFSLGITENMTVDEIIQLEVSKSGFIKQSKRDQFGKTLRLIAENDQGQFLADQHNFKYEFNSSYISYKRVEAQNFLWRYIFMFGADNISLSGNRCFECFTLTDETHGIKEALNYLIKTKPFDRVLDLFKGKLMVKFDKDSLTYLIDRIYETYPDKFSYFQKISIEFIGTEKIIPFFELYEEMEDEKAFKMLPRLIKESNILRFFDKNDKLINAPLLHPEFYLQMTPSEQFFFISLMLKYDDPEMLSQLIGLNPEIILHIETEPFASITDTNIIHRAITLKSIKCLAALIKNFGRELLPATSNGSISALEYGLKREPDMFSSIIYDSCKSGQFVLILSECDFKFDSEFVIDGKKMNLLQWAFKSCCWTSFKYFADLAGTSLSRQIIREVWATDADIIKHIFRNSLNCAPDFISFFQLDVNATYRYENLEGSAAIFLKDKPNFISSPGFYLRNYGIDSNIPIYEINPENGQQKGRINVFG